MSDWRTLSLWMDQLDEPLTARPALGAELQADVAIIGAGYTGQIGRASCRERV